MSDGKLKNKQRRNKIHITYLVGNDGRCNICHRKGCDRKRHFVSAKDHGKSPVDGCHCGSCKYARNGE